MKDDIPERFPLLAVTHPAEGPAECRVLLYKDLPELRASGRRISFLITPAIRPSCEAATRETKEFFAAGFQVLSEEPGRQELLVSATWDDDRVNRGWYAATEDEFLPSRHQLLFGPGLLMVPLFLGIPAWLVYCLVLGLYRRARRRRLAKNIA